jgi:potassium efflux system protein
MIRWSFFCSVFRVFERELEVGCKSKTMAHRPVDAPLEGWVCLPLGGMILAVLILGTSSRGQEPERRSDPQHPPSTGHPSGLPEATPATASAEADVAALRAETTEQLKAMVTSSPGESAKSSAGTGAGPRAAPAAAAAPALSVPKAVIDKQLSDLLLERLRWLDEYDKVSKALRKAMNPQPSPERQVAEAKEELQRLQTILAQAARDPDSLLPPVYGGRPAGVSSGLGAEMKGALEAATSSLKEWKTRRETLSSEVTNWESQQTARRVERDKLFQQVATMKARSAEREAVAAATTAKSRRLAQERLANFEWAARVEVLRLQVVEAQLALEVKLAEVRQWSLQVAQAQVQIAEKTLERMRARYRAATDLQERDLKQEAANEEKKARRSDDPLERFRARRLAELLELEALVVKNEQAEATSPPPSLDEQRSLADHAEADFARIKELLDDGRVSRLDAIRLNNDFRRIGPERDRLVRNEMAAIEARLQFYENTLTNIELELLQDSLHDRFERDLLRERLSPQRWAEGESLLAALEAEQRALLVRRRNALERLTDTTAQTLDQLVRRLHTLDEEYGFIRTHIFWVRDQEPIGLGTLTQGGREFQHVVKGVLKLAQEATNARLWGQPSAEFLVTALAALVLPIGLARLRRVLRGRVDRELMPVLLGVEQTQVRPD